MPAVQVENSGKVIPAYEIEGLFEPFRRSTGDRRDSRRSAGLGLSIVRSVVQAHEGVVTASPRAGGGLVVTVWLPAVESSAARRSIDRCDRPTTASKPPRYREMGLSCTAPHFVVSIRVR